MKRSQSRLIFSLLVVMVLLFAVAYAVTVGVDQDGNTTDNATNSAMAVDAQSASAGPNAITPIQTCHTENVAAWVRNITTCQYTQRNCSDAPVNSSCSMVTTTYSCEGAPILNITPQSICQETGLQVYGKFTIDESQYKCIPSDNGSFVEVICDSRYDGNGNGICESGESCLKYDIPKNSAHKSEIHRQSKNSARDFTDQDNSFFLPDAQMQEASQ